MNFHHSMPDTVFYKHAKCQLPTMYIYYVNVFRYLANLQSPFSQNHLFKTPQGSFYLYNFANNIGMEISFASVESSLTFSPLYRPVPPALDSPFLRPKSPS